MPDFIAKIRLSNGDFHAPVTISAVSKDAALAALGQYPWASDDMEVFEFTAALRAAFGSSQPDAPVVRSDWIWKRDSAVKGP